MRIDVYAPFHSTSALPKWQSNRVSTSVSNETPRGCFDAAPFPSLNNFRAFQGAAGRVSRLLRNSMAAQRAARISSEKADIRGVILARTRNERKNRDFIEDLPLLNGLAARFWLGSTPLPSWVKAAVNSAAAPNTVSAPWACRTATTAEAFGPCYNSSQQPLPHLSFHADDPF